MDYSEKENKKKYDSIEIFDYVKIKKNYYFVENKDIFKVKFKVINKETTTGSNGEILYLIRFLTLFGEEQLLNVWFLDKYDYRNEKLKRITGE